MTETSDPSETRPYDLVGGEAGVRRLVDRFYDLMDAVPQFARIRALHPGDISGSREKLAAFLSGYLGGPPVYQMRYGHPMLRARHLPFPIGEEDRDQWMACMILAMEDVGLEAGLREALTQAFFRTADWMRNREG